MSQHDLTIDNQGFPAFRADLNNALQALGSTQSGTTAPSPTFANQLWYDTTNNILKIRNEDNDAWISLLTLDQSADSVSQISTALAVLSAGTVSAPSITTTGDTNTGIFFPAADTIAFTEGGVESMRIDSSGNVGIGTSSPLGKLEVRGSGNTALYLHTGNNSGDNSLIYFGDTGSATVGLLAYDHGTNAMTFHTNSGERMRIDSSGNVGIGTSSPTNKLSLATTANGGICLNVSSRPHFGATYSSDSLVLGYSVKPNPSTVDGMVGTETNSGGGAPAAILMNSGVIQFHTATSVTSGAAFSSERMRIDSSGNVLVGTTSSYGNVTVDIGSGQFTTDEKNGTLTVKSDVGGRPLIMVRSTSSGQDTAFRFSANRSGTQDAWTIGCHIARNSDNLSINYGTTNTSSGTEKFYFTSAGAAYNTTGTWGTISDSRFKENIVDATPKLDKINQLKVRNFNLIDDYLKQIGLIAQEVEEIFPSLVETNELKDGKEQKTVKMSVFVPILIKAIQELKAELDSVKAELQTLKGN